MILFHPHFYKTIVTVTERCAAIQMNHSIIHILIAYCYSLGSHDVFEFIVTLTMQKGDI